MPKNKDTRDFEFNRVSASNLNPQKSAVEVSDVLAGAHRVRVERINSFTGSPADVQSINAPSAIAVDSAGEERRNDAALITQALNHLDSISPALGFLPGQKAEFVPDSFVKKTSAGASVVNLQQQYKGIPVFSMERAVIFGNDGEIKNTTGTNVSLPLDLETYPVVPLQTATKAAAEYMSTPGDDVDPWTGEPLPEIEIDVTGYEPEILGQINLPSQPAVLAQGPFGESIPAHLVLFYQGATTRLGWHFVISQPDMMEQYVIIVEADAQTTKREKPEILYAQKTSSHMAAKGKVWIHNPGVSPERTLVDFPLDVSVYPLDASALNLPKGFPQAWVDNGGSTAVGNYTIAVTGNTTDSISGSHSDGVLIFDPGEKEAQGDVQKVINIFYFCNYMHDFFYMLGFDERHGNFQKINFTGTGTGNDPVLARAHPGPVRGTANMLTRADGVRAEMNMGLVSGINRHTAFDSDVVFHEFTHGVTNRLVGGKFDARALQQPQSRGMGEGWSDYFALTIQNCLALIHNPNAREKTVTGDWVVNRPRGIRLAPYDEKYPATYGGVGTSPYDEEHAVGEIWCAALMKMNRDFGAALDDKVRGHRVGWQAVVDGLKLAPSNPGFLDARDAVLHALQDLRSAGSLTDDEFQRLNKAAWLAFARFGMGPGASSIGASLNGIYEDTTPPKDI
ncbi:MAG TPA: M36 family metallopeptidase [Pyrinomonadaceae bacterium]|jgi:extracellular elastinolytic metalloproteinase